MSRSTYRQQASSSALVRRRSVACLSVALSFGTPIGAVLGAADPAAVPHSVQRPYRLTALAIAAERAGFVTTTHRADITRKHGDRPAAVRPVTSCLDDGSAGTLRSVIGDAVDGDQVDLTQLTCSKITLTGGDVEIHVDTLTVQGPGQASLIIDGNGTDRVFAIYSYGTVTFNDLTVTHGFKGGTYAPAGGCIYSYFSSPDNLLVLNRVTVSGCAVGDANSSYALGGGIWTRGSLHMQSSTISENTATGRPNTVYLGGGVGVWRDATIVDSVFRANAAVGITQGGYYGRGGGLFSSGANPTHGWEIQNSTFSDNLAGSYGGAIYLYAQTADATATIINSTISGNSARSGGGVVGPNATLHLSNTTVTSNTGSKGCGGVHLTGLQTVMQSSIVANNIGSMREGDICGSGSVEGQNNLIRSSSVAVPADTISDDPLLGALADNGGSTFTHALLSDSPAIDAGNNASDLAYDQRGLGYPRVSGVAADIGAFELRDSNVIFADGFDNAQRCRPRAR